MQQEAAPHAETHAGFSEEIAIPVVELVLEDANDEALVEELGELVGAFVGCATELVELVELTECVEAVLAATEDVDEIVFAELELVAAE